MWWYSTTVENGATLNLNKGVLPSNH
jgi:hypothetical protein